MVNVDQEVGTLRSTSSAMNEETIKKWMREIERRRPGASPRPGPGGFFAGGGLALLVLGGLAINASMFTGVFWSSIAWVKVVKRGSS